MLEPVGGFGEGEEFGVGAVTQTFMGHIGQKERVALTPENTRRDMDSAIRKPGAAAKESAIPIDHGSEGTGLGPCCTVHDKIVGRESLRAAGAEQRGSADTEVETGEESLGHVRKLEEKDIPASKRLTQMGHHIAAHHRRMRHVDNHELGYASRLEKGRAPADSGAPVMSNKEDFLLTELIGDGNDVGDQFGEGVR